MGLCVGEFCFIQLVAGTEQVAGVFVQPGAENARQRFDVQNPVPDGAGHCQIFSGTLVVKLRPEHAGHIQQINAVFHGDPLLVGGNARPVFHTGLFAAGQPVHQG